MPELCEGNWKRQEMLDPATLCITDIDVPAPVYPGSYLITEGALYRLLTEAGYRKT